MVDQAISGEMLCGASLCDGLIGRERGDQEIGAGAWHGMACEKYLCDYLVAETTCGGSEAVSGEFFGHNWSKS